MSKTGDGSSFWVLVAIVVGFAMLLQAIGGNSGGSTTTSSYSPSSGTPEHRYVRERFRQEGYSDAESRQAADAIMKFHEAQKNRD